MLDGAAHARQPFAQGRYLRHPSRSLRAYPQYRISPMPAVFTPTHGRLSVRKQKGHLGRTSWSKPSGNPFGQDALLSGLMLLSTTTMGTLPDRLGTCQAHTISPVKKPAAKAQASMIQISGSVLSCGGWYRGSNCSLYCSGNASDNVRGKRL